MKYQESQHTQTHTQTHTHTHTHTHSHTHGERMGGGHTQLHKHHCPLICSCVWYCVSRYVCFVLFCVFCLFVCLFFLFVFFLGGRARARVCEHHVHTRDLHIRQAPFNFFFYKQKEDFGWVSWVISNGWLICKSNKLDINNGWVNSYSLLLVLHMYLFLSLFDRMHCVGLGPVQHVWTSTVCWFCCLFVAIFSPTLEEHVQ